MKTIKTSFILIWFSLLILATFVILFYFLLYFDIYKTHEINYYWQDGKIKTILENVDPYKVKYLEINFDKNKYNLPIISFIKLNENQFQFTFSSSYFGKPIPNNLDLTGVIHFEPINFLELIISK